MVCGRVEAVSVDDDCMDNEGHIIWDRRAPGPGPSPQSGPMEPLSISPVDAIDRAGCSDRLFDAHDFGTSASLALAMICGGVA
jgi:hypothetical protein